MSWTTTDDWRAEQRTAAKELRTLLIDRELQQVDVAEEMQISQTSMSDWLNGRRRWPSAFQSDFKAAVKRIGR